MANGQIFHDTSGRSWLIRVRVPEIKRVREMTTIDLTDFRDGKLFTLAMDDAEKLVAVLWALVKPEAEKLSVQPDDFGGSLDGDSLALAGAALLKELIAFAPPQRRRVMQASIDELTAGLEQATETAVNQIKQSNLRQMLVDTASRQIADAEKKLAIQPETV